MTGVQTCALPISLKCTRSGADLGAHLLADHAADLKGTAADHAAGIHAEIVLTVQGSDCQIAPAHTLTAQGVANLLSDRGGHSQGHGLGMGHGADGV